ncbi:mitotic spindle assembly checkpoint protein MAD1 [Blastomyces silverae]|uniref:Spindle assembly checkpoint component MAD1 n=1 Tax=Blastomyces silverae TaxID=2060906 RepID=A0A0H1B954_9EURO|nr:mitotic spindle assembly checkpoint protein MAD1 [Blastomyces silverae]
MNTGRFATTQPTYDFIAGASSPSPSSAGGGGGAGNPSFRQSIRSGQPPKAVVDTGNEELRVQINTLLYELDNLKQERDLTALHHEKELRELQIRADADFRKAQAAEGSSNRAQHKIESLTTELKTVQESAINEKAAFDKRIRSLEDHNRSLQEEIYDTQSQLSDQERQYKHQINELEAIRSSLQKTLEEVQTDLHQTKDSLQVLQDKFTQLEADAGALESENIRLKSEGTDSETLNVLKRELSEQLAHAKRLDAELRPLRKSQKNVEVVEEQKKALENRLHLMQDVEVELRNVQIQNQALEDERRSWTSLLQSDGQDPEFESPEEVARALVEARIENASLLNKVGTIQTDVAEKAEVVQNLETEKSNLQQEIAKLRAGSNSVGNGFDSRAKTRLERQRTLAIREVEYLRAQLKTFETEETTMNADETTFDQQKSDHIAHLESLLSEHREELHKLHEELSKQEKTPVEDTNAPRGVKRPLSPADSDAESERLAVLTRKNRSLQDNLSKAEQSIELLTRELEATKSHLSILQAQSRTRILELRSNPTAEAEKVKLSTLAVLRAENRDLLAQLRNERSNVKVVPLSTLESKEMELREMEKAVAEKEKRMRRLKEIWTAKSSEFREAVASVLGYKLDFLPNGRVRVTSMFHLSPAYRHGDRDASPDARGPGSMGDGEENSIIFDGENGTMKISGGPNSLFAMEIRSLIKFWVEERKDIPCFLAAMTLDFYDKTTRAARV